MGKLVADLRARGIIQDTSHDELLDELDKGQLTFYAGFDPTSKSLQIGNLFVVTTMMRLQRAGHKPLAIVGGATGMIGDPSGKNSERNLLDEATLKANIEGQKKQLQRFLNFDCGENSAELLNNYEWVSKFSFIDFLRDVGKRFRLNEMLAKDSVKSRLASDAGISYTEFSYQILQSYDFSYLNKKYNCRMQIGATDQWGNITAGIDLTRKMNSEQVFGLVIPLVTDASGKKFGKSEGGNTIYLDPDITSPYQMYQFLLNSDDSIVGRYLRYYTFLELDKIEELEQKCLDEPHLRAAQKALAEEVVLMVHGEEGMSAAQRATQFFFGGKIEKVTDKEVESIFADVPSISIERALLTGDGLNILELLSQTPLFKSKGEARRSVQQKGVYLNNLAVIGIEQDITSKDLASESSLVIRKGKKNYCVVTFS